MRQTDRKLRKKFAGIRKKFGSIRSHLKGLTFSVILLGNRIRFYGEYAANINVLHSQYVRHSVRVSSYSQRHTNDRECLRTPTHIWRSFCDHCELWNSRPGEKWVSSTDCGKWDHEECTSRDRCYVCHSCESN